MQRELLIRLKKMSTWKNWKFFVVCVEWGKRAAWTMTNTTGRTCRGLVRCDFAQVTSWTAWLPWWDHHLEVPLWSDWRLAHSTRTCVLNAPSVRNSIEATMVAGAMKACCARAIGVYHSPYLCGIFVTFLFLELHYLSLGTMTSSMRRLVFLSKISYHVIYHLSSRRE